MSYLVIGDLHYKDTNLEELHIFEKFVLNIYDPSIKNVVLLGDILDHHSKFTLQSLVNAIQFMEKLAERYKVFVLIGNHDRINNQDFLSDYHPFYGIKDDKITIINKPILRDQVCFIPYVPPGRFMEAFNTLNCDIRDVKIIFAHQELSGCHYNCIASTAENWSSSHPLCVSGHIHQFQKVSNNLIYLGSPIQHFFDEPPDKYIMKIDISGEYQLMPYRFSLKKVEQFDFKEFMEFVPEDHVKYKINVEVTMDEKNLIEMSDLYKEIKDKHRIIFKIKMSKKEYERHTFSEFLSNYIKAAGLTDFFNAFIRNNNVHGIDSIV